MREIEDAGRGKTAHGHEVQSPEGPERDHVGPDRVRDPVPACAPHFEVGETAREKGDVVVGEWVGDLAEA